MSSALKRFDILFVFFPSYWRQKRQIQILKDYMRKIINERRMIVSQKANGNLQNNNESEELFYKKRKMAFLDNLLTAEVDKRRLTFQEIFEEVSTFLFEGHDTTASAITFMFFCLSRNPEIQEKLYEEQMRLSSELEWNPSYEDILEMKYMDLVIKETLRLFPSVPIIARTLQKPMVVSEFT
uniref:Cytochrome P450 n=1 Tax=Megaselia scalaris TaxID=36166 RepID=T1GNR2_MEGSC